MTFFNNVFRPISNTPIDFSYQEMKSLDELPEHKPNNEKKMRRTLSDSLKRATGSPLDPNATVLPVTAVSLPLPNPDKKPTACELSQHSVTDNMLQREELPSCYFLHLPNDSLSRQTGSSLVQQLDVDLELGQSFSPTRHETRRVDMAGFEFQQADVH